MKRPLDLSGTPNLRDLMTEATRLGCDVSHRHRTGELRVIAPSGERVNLNSRRKDGARAIIRVLRRLQQQEPRS
jgi:hypothetical protein